MLKITYRLKPRPVQDNPTHFPVKPRPVRVQIQIIHMVNRYRYRYCCTRSSLVATQLGKNADSIYAMQDRVKAELDRMQSLGVITPVSEPADWVLSMVVTHKKDRQEIRQCINPKDLNTALKRPHLPMRSIEEVASQMLGATVFSVLDAKNPFWQIRLDRNSSMMATFSTPFGRYRFL